MLMQIGAFVRSTKDLTLRAFVPLAGLQAVKNVSMMIMKFVRFAVQEVWLTASVFAQRIHFLIFSVCVKSAFCRAATNVNHLTLALNAMMNEPFFSMVNACANLDTK